MGAALAHPVCSQVVSRVGSKHMRVAGAEMQGYRLNMEDTNTLRTSLSDKHPNLAFFGVYDGHAGNKASEFLEAKLYEYVGKLDDPMDSAQLTDALVKADEEFLARENEKQHGSASLFAVVRPPVEGKEAKGQPDPKKFRIAVANTGDSRAFIIRADGTFKCLTNDHKPENEEEKARIQAAGGFVQQNRVDGQLAMSRAFGDSPYKDNPNLKYDEQKVIVVPEVSYETAVPGDSLLICCDGLVEQLSNEQVCQFVLDELKKTPEDPAKIMGELILYSLRKGSKDNHSAVLVQFADGTGYGPEKEFVAGPLKPYLRDRKFCEAYFEYAAKHGYTNKDELLKMSEKAEETMDTKEEDEDNGGVTINLGGQTEDDDDKGIPIRDPEQMIRMMMAGGINLAQLLGMDQGEGDDDDEGMMFGLRPEDDEDEDYEAHAGAVPGGKRGVMIEEMDDDEEEDEDQDEEEESKSKAKKPAKNATASAKKESTPSSSSSESASANKEKKKKKKKNKKKKPSPKSAV